MENSRWNVVPGVPFVMPVMFGGLRWRLASATIRGASRLPRGAHTTMGSSIQQRSATSGLATGAGGSAKATGIWARVDGFHERNPMLCSIFWAGIKGGIASIIADMLLHQYNKMQSTAAPGLALEQDGAGPDSQDGCQPPPASRQDNSTDATSFVDWNKTVAFTLWSGFYCGSVLKILYNDLFPKIFPLTKQALVEGKKVMIRHPAFRRHVLFCVLADNFVSTPFFFNPSYFVIKSMLEGAPDGAEVGPWWTPAAMSFCVRRAYDRYSVEWFGACRVTWGFWIPIHFLTFSVIPPHWRVPFTASCSAVTLCVQSINQTWLEQARPAEGAGSVTVSATVSLHKDHATAATSQQE